MRKLKLLFACLLMTVLGIGQLWAADATITWSFKTLQTTSGTQDGVTWETGKTGSATATACNSSNGLVLYGVTSGGGYFQTTSAIGGTITNVNIVSTAKKNTPKYTVYCSTDGSTWDEITSNQTAGTKDHAVTGSYTYVKVANTTAATAQLAVTSITVTYTTSGGGGGGSTPSVSVDPASWDFGSVATDASASKVFSVSGSDLEAGTLTLTAPSGYSVSPATITVASAGSLDATNVTVSKNTATAGTYDANLTISGCGLEDAVEVALSMEVKAEYTVTWNNNGSTSTTQVLDGEKPVFPTTPASCDATSTTFIGWATEAWTGKLADLSGKTVYTSASAMPAVDATVTYYAVFAKASGSTGTLFEWEGGAKAGLTALDNVVTHGLGSDYAASNGDYRIKFDDEGDYIIITTSGAISSVAVGVKMIGGNSTSHILVQEAEDAQGEFSTVESLEISGAQNDVVNLATTNAFNSASRAVKLLFNKGANVGVGPISIVGAASGEDYMTTCCTKYNVNIAAGITNGSVSADPASACEGTIVTLTFTPSLNYHLSGWTLNGTAQDVNNNTFTMPAEAVTVSATFAEDACTPLNTPSVTVSGKAYPYDAVQLSWAAVSFADVYKVYIYDAEDNELEHNDAFTGVEYTIGKTLSGSTTYKYSVQAVSNTPTAYCPSTAATGTFVTDALPTAHLNLVDIDGTHASSGDYAILTPFNLPTTAAACAKTFVGWDADTDCATAPTYAKGAEFTFANTTGVTLYAVYADATQGVANDPWILTSSDITKIGSGTSYADYNGERTKDGVTFTTSNVMTGSSTNAGKIQFKASAGMIYNTTAFDADIVSIEVDGLDLAVYEGTAAISSTPSTGAIAKSEGVYPFSAGKRYFHLKKNTSGAGYASSITITLAGEPTYSNYSTTCVEKVATPAFTLVDGTYTTAQTVGITCATDGATIYYTTDGTYPTTSSTEYTAAISLSERGAYTIKAIAVKAGSENSEVAEAEYKINPPFATVADLFTYLGENITYNLGNVTVTGYVSEIVTEYNSTYHNVTYNISDDGMTTSAQLQSYRGLGVKNGDVYEDADLVTVGDKVTITGTYQVHNSTKELDANNYIITRIAKGAVTSVVVSGTATKTVYSNGETFLFDGLVATATYANGYATEVTPDSWAANPATVTADGNIAVTATVGEVTSPAYNVAVTVGTKTLVSIAVGTPSYTIYSGEALPHPAVTATFNEGEPENVSALAIYDTENVFDTNTPDDYTVTVSYTFGSATQTATYTVSVQDYANDVNHPYTVAEAIYIITNAIGTTASARDIYVQGIVSQKNNPGSGAQTYYISDDGTTTGQMKVYKGKYFDGANFIEANKMMEGDQVIVSGKVMMYESTPEFDAGSWVRSQTRVPGLAISNVASLEVGQPDLELSDLDVTVDGDGEITLVSGDDATATIVNNAIHAVAPGTVTITANLAADGIYSANSTTFTVTVIAAQTRYAVTFAANGGEGNAPVMEDQLEGATFNLPANTFTYTGFQFAGWNDGTTTYGAGAEYTMPAQPVTFTAQWNAVCPWASVYTSNVSFAWTGESGESNSKVKINDTEYVAQKVGAKEKTGSVTVTVPAGTHTLHFHAAAWNSASSMTIEASVNNMSVSSFAIAADAGVNNSGTYTLAGDPIDQHFHFTFNPVAEETVITFSKASGDDNRFVMYGINQEGGPELQSITIGGNATNTEYVYGQTFNPAGLTVSAVYRVSGVDQDPVDVTDRVVWTFDPAAFNSTSQTTVTATATFETKSASKTVNVTVSEPATPNVTYTAIVVKKGDKYYAMGQTLSSGALNAVELEDVVNGKMVNVPVEDRTALTWIITEKEDGATFQAQNGKYLSGNGSNTTLSWSTDPVVWAWNDTYGCYAIGGRSFYMYNSTTQFKNFALSNMNDTPSQCSSKPENLSEYIDIDNTKEIVTLRSGLENGKIGTMCWNAAIYEVEGAYFFEPEMKQADGVCFAEAAKEGGVYPMGKPYVFQATGEEIRAVVSKTNTTTVAGTNNGLHGVLGETVDVNGENYYIIYQNRLYTANNNYIVANRAYIVKSELPGASANPAPNRRRLVIGRDNLPTGIESIVLNAEQVKKVLVDGQIYIVRDGKLYDLTGKVVR